MNYIFCTYNMRNRKDAPEERDLCKKQMYQKVSIPEEYYLVTVIFSLWDLYGFRQTLSLTICQIDESSIKIYEKYSLLYSQ